MTTETKNWYVSQATYGRSGRAIEGTVPTIEMDEDGIHVLVVSLGASNEDCESMAHFLAAAPALLARLTAQRDALREAAQAAYRHIDTVMLYPACDGDQDHYAQAKSVLRAALALCREGGTN